ncbi:MAG: hypothetical protein KGL39_12645 [Patescibacteria group bacterium]|nr:hypothetical protein [Patescibacteria group bacterium]
MAIDFTQALGSLFPRLGKLGVLIKNVNSHQATQLTALTDDTPSGIINQFGGEPDIQALIGSSYIGLLAAPEAVCGLAQQVAEQTVNRIVYRDNPRLSQTLQSLQTLVALQELIRQMKVNGSTVQVMTITTPKTFNNQSPIPGPYTFTGNLNTPTNVSAIGNGVMMLSHKRPFDGLILENILGEVIQFTCTSDSYTSGATAGNESFSVTGTGSEGDVFAFDWPLGSNAQVSVQAIDGGISAGSGNLLTNSGFDSFTTGSSGQPNGPPLNWALNVVGTYTTNYQQDTTTVFDRTSDLQFTGDGSTLVSFQQQFNSTAGTISALQPLTQYSVVLWLRNNGTTPANGVLTLELISTDNTGTFLGNISDANNVTNKFTIDLTKLTTTYTSYGGVFRTPDIFPAGNPTFRFRLSTALSTGTSVFMDKLSMGPMTQLYTSGPFISVHSGKNSTPFAQGDYGYIKIVNWRLGPEGTQGSLSTWQTLFSQLFPDMTSSELLLPSSASPTIKDSWIT